MSLIKCTIDIMTLDDYLFRIFMSPCFKLQASSMSKMYIKRFINFRTSHLYSMYINCPCHVSSTAYNVLASPTYLQLWKTVSHVDSRECRNNSDFSQTFCLDAAVSFILFRGVVRVYTRHGLISIVNCAI